MSGSVLRNNDEILIKVENPDLSTAYQQNLNTIWSRAKCSNPPAGQGTCP